MHSKVEEYLFSLERESKFRVERVLKESPYGTTELVFYDDHDKEDACGAAGEHAFGPFIRKRLSEHRGFESVYKLIYEAQKSGRAFKHLPYIYDYYQTEDGETVVMEFVKGETLADLLYREGPSISLAERVFPDICDSVTELHTKFDQPIIHRDLKPSNVMVQFGKVTVIDFGIARSYKDNQEKDTTHFGTPSYAPPEQFGFGQTDVRSDVYALGMLLYYCLTEQTPNAHAMKDDLHTNHIPDALQAVLLKATAFDPQERYASAEDLKNAFLAACGQTSSYDATNRGNKLRPHCPDSWRKWDNGDVAYCPDLEDEKGVGAFRHFLKRIPCWVGHIWNIVLLLGWLLLLYASIVATVDPSPKMALIPFAVRAIAYLGTFTIAPLFLVFLLSDKRSLRKRVPRLQKTSWKIELAICLAGFVIIAFVSLGIYIVTALSLGI